MIKRGNTKGLLMLETIIKLLIAIIVIALIIYAGTVLFQTYFGKQGEMQAKGTVDKAVQTLRKANESGITEKLFIDTPKGWYIIAFDPDNNENQGFRKPSSMFGKSCVCVCQGSSIKKICKTEICRQIKMPLKQAGELAFIKIEIKDVYFTNMQNYWEASEKPVSMTKLTDEEKQEYWILKTGTKKNYGSIITKTAEQYYKEEDISKHFDNATDFSNFLLAIIVVESSGDANAKSKCGAVGLMQLMPATAREQGLNVPDYAKICGGANNPCIGRYAGCSIAFECNKFEPEKCDEEKDERFDPEKNIRGGTKYIVYLFKQFDDKQLVLAAYNVGASGLEDACKPLINIYSCHSDFPGRIYSEKVIARYHT